MATATLTKIQIRSERELAFYFNVLQGKNSVSPEHLIRVPKYF